MNDSSPTPRQRVEIALRGGHSDHVPFTIYEKKIPQCDAERRMRNRGLCIVKRDVPVFKCHRPNVKVTAITDNKTGKSMTRHVYETPVGTLSTLSEQTENTTWYHEKMFKTPDDYSALLSLIQDEQYEPCYDVFAQAQDRFGHDAIFRSYLGLEPLQTLISDVIMDMQMFCIQWMDHRDEILKLYEAIVCKRRELYPIVAQSPALHANYGGNVTPSVIGLEMFEKYYVPHYNEAAEIMHNHGKLIGCHFDDNCRLLADTIAGTDLDYIEAFTPAPDTDMTLADARRAWPDKVLWINFPSSVHLQPDETVRSVTRGLLDQADRLDGLIMGITEDIPEDRWRDSCSAIMDGLETYTSK